MLKYKYLCFLAYLLNVSFLGYTQIPIFRKTEKRLTIEDGLKNRHVNTAFVDKKNKIWFLTDNQLSNFDYGTVNNLQLSPDFSNRGFNHVFEDAKGNLWISECVEWFYPFNVVKTVIFNPRSKKIIPVRHYINSEVSIHSLTVDNQGNVLIGTKDGKVFHFDVHTQKLQQKLVIAKAPLKILYAGRKGMVVCLEKDTKNDQQLLYFSNDGKLLKSETLNNTFVRQVVEMEDELIVFYQKSQKYAELKSITSDKKVTIKALKGLYLWSLRYDSGQKLLVLSESSSLTFLNHHLKVLTKEDFQVVIHDFCIDTFNNYILSTNDGLYIVNISGKTITTYLHNGETSSPEEQYSCRGILKINANEVVVNTNKKRQIIDIRSHKVRELNNFKNENGKVDQFVLSSIKDKDGNVFFGEDGLVRTDIKKGKDELWCAIDSTKIWAIEEYRQGLLLGLEKKGVVFFDKKTRKAKVISTLLHELANAIVYDFYIVKDTVYIASEKGLYQLTRGYKWKKMPFVHKENTQRMCFHLSKDTTTPRRILVATSNGIWKYSMDNEQLVPFSADPNVLNKKYLSVYQTKNGVWASSEQGIWRFDHKGTLLKIYTEADGLTSNECNRLSHFYDEEEDKLYFGGINGLNVLNTAAIHSQQKESFGLRVDSVLIYAGNTLQRGIADYKLTELKLAQDEQSLELRFWYEDFRYQCAKQYYYRTNEPTEKEWRPINSRSLFLNTIGYGKTELEVRVVSCNDYLNAKTMKLILHREYPIYLKWYFWVGVLLVIALLTAAAIRLSNEQLRKRNQYLRQKVDEQTLSLRESLEHKEMLLRILIHDVRYPVQSFYELSRKLNFLIRKQDTERLLLLGKETEERSRKVLWLIDELVLWVKSSSQNWQLRYEDRSLKHLIEQILESYGEELQVKKLIIEMPDRELMAKFDSGLMTIVIRNLIFNAISYAPVESVLKIDFGRTAESKYHLIIVNRVSVATTLQDKGLGIGLSLLMPILEKASINLRSRIVEDVYTVTVDF